MARRRVIVYNTAIESLFFVGGDAYEWNLRTTRRIEAMATHKAPIRTAHLAASHGVEQNRDAIGRYQSGFKVTNDAPHAVYVALGTGIYGPTGSPIVYSKRVGPITPPREAGPVFIRSQLGQKPNNWIARAADIVLGPIVAG